MKAQPVEALPSPLQDTGAPASRTLRAQLHQTKVCCCWQEPRCRGRCRRVRAELWALLNQSLLGHSPLSIQQHSCRWPHLIWQPWGEKIPPGLTGRTQFHWGSAEKQSWRAKRKAETQGMSHQGSAPLQLTAFTSTPWSPSHKYFDCSHVQRFGLGRHPALLSRSKMTTHTFLEVWKKQPSRTIPPPSGY